MQQRLSWVVPAQDLSGGSGQDAAWAAAWAGGSPPTLTDVGVGRRPRGFAIDRTTWRLAFPGESVLRERGRARVMSEVDVVAFPQPNAGRGMPATSCLSREPPQYSVAAQGVATRRGRLGTVREVGHHTAAGQEHGHP